MRLVDDAGVKIKQQENRESLRSMRVMVRRMIHDSARRIRE
jgi:hypothetical protein